MTTLYKPYIIRNIKGIYIYQKGGTYMELHRYDIIEAELDYGSGSIQKKRRPYIIVSNEKGTTNATIITVMPLTSAKKKRLPVHECLEARSETGLTKYSMILGEQPQTNVLLLFL